MVSHSAASAQEYAELRSLAERSLEDERGVDLTQIRARLRLTPAQRVTRLLEQTEAWSAIRGRVRGRDA